MTADQSTPADPDADGTAEADPEADTAAEPADAAEADAAEADAAVEPADAAEADADPADPISVLLVDDDEDFVALASTLLEAESDRIETTTETRPTAALDRADLTAIDCIVSDYRMPGMNGIEFLTAIRKRFPDLPFILFTGKGDEQVAKRAIAADVSDYIVKDGSAEQYAISANRIANLVDQYRARERARRKQALDTLSQTVLETVLTEPTRAAIEQGVCDRLIESNLYAAAWIGEPDAHSDAVIARAQAGKTEVFDAVSFTTDGERSVEAQALVTGEPQADTLTDPDDAWATAAADHGFSATVGLPLVHEGVPYGVLGVYTTRSAVGDDETTVLETLAELTAFAIGASERRRGDTSRQVVAIEFAVGESDLPFVRLADALGCGVALVGTTHRNDGTTLTRYRLAEVPPSAVATVEAVLDAESIALAEDGRRELSVVTTEPWLPDLIEVYGANVETAAVDDDGARLVVELPPSAEVRAVVDAIETQYPGVEPVARRERTRSEQSVGELRGQLAETLTDRQQEVVETAFRAGYYEWPREASSEAVADQLGIAQPTFAEHVATAHRRIVDCLFEPDADADRRQPGS